MARRKRRAHGEGSIHKRADGRWEGAIVVGYASNGSRRRRSVYGATKQEVVRKLTELRYLHQEGLLTDASGMTLEQLAHRWLDSRGNVLPDTLYKYGRELRPILDLIGNVKLSRLKAHHVRDAYSAMARAGLAVRTQKRAAMHIRSMLQQAVQDDLIHKSPAEGVRVSAPRVSPIAKVWTAAGVRAFLEEAEGDPLYPYFYLLLSLGLRSGETLGLPWRAVDFSQGKLSVYQALRRVHKGSRLVISEVKTPHSRRTLHVPHDVLEELAHLRSQQGSRANGSALVVATREGNPVDPSNTRRTLLRLAEAAEVPSIRVQDLRHTHASLALAAGVPVEVVSRRLGHASIAITLDLYRHLYEPEMRNAALSLDQLLAGRPNSDDGA